LRPPLGLLPEPRRARVTGVSSAHHEEVGGASSIFREQSRFLRTKTSRPMPIGATEVKVIHGGAVKCRRPKVRDNP